MNGRNLLAPPERHQDCCGYIIRFVPPLNLAVLIDTTGRGVLDQGLAIHILKTAFGYHRQTVYKHLDKGDGVYWRKHTTRKGRAIIISQGLLRVARHLEEDIRRRGRFVELLASILPCLYLAHL